MLAFSLSVPALAEDTNKVIETDDKLSRAKSDMLLKVVKGENYLVAVVPLEIPIVVDQDGVITTPSNLKIQNLSKDEIVVRNACVTVDMLHGKDIQLVANVNSLTSKVTAQMNIGIKTDETQYNMTVPAGNQTGQIETGNTWKIAPETDSKFSIMFNCSPYTYSELTESTKFGAITFTIGYST